MEKIILENDVCKVEISQQAAEVHHYWDKETGIDYIWMADPQFWAFRNPTLFPHVGSLPEGKYTLNGKTYTSGNHGFARHAWFELVETTNETVVLSLKNNPKLKAESYPFDFELRIQYQLTNKKLMIQYQIRNLDSCELPFEIGMHPAFNVPFTDSFTYEDYSLVFEHQERSTAQTKSDQPYLLDGNVIDLRRDPFQYSKALFFKNLKSNYVLLTDKTHVLEIGIGKMEQVGIWRPSNTAPMICIEPWLPKNTLKRKDTFGRGKENWLLPAGASFEFSYYFLIR